MSADRPCGARRPGWERPGFGRLRLPCVLARNEHHDHRDALGNTWAAAPVCEECGCTDGLRVEPHRGALGAPVDRTLCAGCRSLPSAAPDQSPRTLRACAGCNHVAATPFLVRVIETSSAASRPLFACFECASRFLTAEAAFQLALEHVRSCRACSAGEALCATAEALHNVYLAAVARGNAIRRTGP
ncbi:hypothetical protein ACH437_08990 [Streptomyces xinghaiensis]|uniref:hypothetical protein n=1 Tax=Streptomyces xinghaiensis TaxID=1038928 RepID=UPI0037A11F2D